MYAVHAPERGTRASSLFTMTAAILAVVACSLFWASLSPSGNPTTLAGSVVPKTMRTATTTRLPALCARHQQQRSYSRLSHPSSRSSPYLSSSPSSLVRPSLSVFAEEEDTATAEPPVADATEDDEAPAEEAKTTKLFAVIEMAENAETIPSALEKNPELKEKQEAYLKDLMDKKLVVSSGSFETQEALTGIWVLKADSLEAALKIRDNSPYWTAGVIPNTIVRQWNAVGDLVSDGTEHQVEAALQELESLKELRDQESAKAETYAAQVSKVQDAYVRVMDDFETYKKRSNREMEMARVDGKGAALRKLLPLIDSFFIAFDAVQPTTEGEKIIDESYKALYEQMIDIFKTEGLEEVGVEGEPFDADKHQAVESVLTEEFPHMAVMNVIRAGFRIDGRVIRPAFVQIANNPADEARQAAEAAEARAKAEAEAAAAAEAAEKESSENNKDESQ